MITVEQFRNNKIALQLIYWVLLFVSIFVVAFRDFNIGADTVAYAEFFFGVREGWGMEKFEPGFYWGTRAIAFICGEVWFYFLFINCFFVFFYFKSFSVFVEGGFLGRVVLLAVVFLSSWYFTAVTNGLRQALALAIFYLSLALFYRENKLRAVFFLALAVFFHYSILLFLPFLFVLFLGRRLFLFVFFCVSFGYLIGVNEGVVAWVSLYSGYDLYGYIKNYAEGDAPWIGFDWRFYIYSNFWVFFFLAFRSLVRVEFRQAYDGMVTIYAFLLFPFMAFGFGPFPNRYAFSAWLFLPMLQSALILFSRIPFRPKLIGVLVLLLVASVVFYSRFYF